MKDLYAIVGIAKLKTAGNVQGVLSHMLRTRPTPNSDGRENDVLITPPPLPEIMQEVNSYCPRKNAVIAYDMLLAASPEFFDGKTPGQVTEWAEASLQWACRKFGRQNIKAAVLHLDEQETGSPHLSLLVIPEVNQKLNARYYTGGREKLRALWTEYAVDMKPFGLVRGREFSPAKHKQIKDYYADIREGEKLAAKRKVKAADLPAPTMGDRVNPREYAAELINKVTAYLRRENGNLRAALQAAEKELEQVKGRTARDRQLYREMQDSPDMVKELREALRGATMSRAEEQAKYKTLIDAIGRYFRKNIPGNSPLRKPEALGTLRDIPELQRDINLSLTPEARERQGMERTR